MKAKICRCVALQHSLGREEMAGCDLVWSLCYACVRCSDGAAVSRWTQESHRARLHQPAQVRRRHRHDVHDISRPKVPLISSYTL